MQSDGTVSVTETIAVDFKNLQKHGIFRDVPYVYRDATGSRTHTRITDIAVQQDGAPGQLEETRNAANLRLRIGDPDETISGPHTYELRYRVHGVLRSHEGFDELYWNVTGTEWEVPIARAQATIRVPASILQSACYEGAAGSSTVCQRSEPVAGAVHFASSPLAVGEGLTVAVGYAPGVIPIITVAAPPTLQELLVAPLTLVSFAAVGFSGVAYVVWRWLYYGRDRFWRRPPLPGERSDREGTTLPETVVPILHQQSVSVEYEPPDGLRPAEVGVLMDEKANPLDISVTIVDMASRGYLTITEIPKTWLLGKSDYEFARTAKGDANLVPYEKLLLHDVFRAKERVRMSSLKKTFYKHLPDITSRLYEEVVRKKLFPANPERVRVAYFGTSLVVAVLGVGAVVLAYKFMEQAGAVAVQHSLLAGGGAGLVLAGVAGLIFARGMSRRTGYGRELYQRLRGYKLFVSGTEKYRAKFYEDTSLFVQVLPYAIVFGVTDKLAQAFKEMGVQPPTPTWLHGVAAFNAAHFAAEMDTFSHALSTTMASTPSGSGSGGGGSVGGGSGGGGGGSW